MPSPLTAVSLVALALAAPGLAAAQEAASAADPAAEEAITGPVIVVQGTRIRGQLDAGQPPVAELNEADIEALGAGSVAEVVAALAPATGSAARGSRGGGQPVFLINGIRVTSPREFGNYPSEAIAKVEVFSEEVAQRFGYSPDQRVVNLVLKAGFNALTLDGEVEAPARGGFAREELGASYLTIGESGRLNLSGKVENAGMLTEAERDLGDESRSLRAASRDLALSANYVRANIDDGSSLSVNGGLTRSESDSRLGRSSDGLGIIERDSRSDGAALGGSYSRRLGDWDAVVTGDADYSLTRVLTDSRDGPGRDETRTQITTFVNKATLSGAPFDLPAGDVSMALDAGFDWKRIASEDSRNPDGDTALVRRRLRAGGNLGIPIAQRGGAWGAVGDVSLNVSGSVQDLSDFGLLGEYSAGVVWGPFDRLSLSATRIEREVAPSISQLGAPRLEDYFVPVFDPRTGMTTDVTIVTGGNPALRAERQRDWKLGANWELPFWENARLQLDYGRNASRDVTVTPFYSAAFEAAFPNRVSRAADGTLLAIDRRPVTLAETRSEVLGLGLTARGTIGKAPPEPPRGEGAGPGGPGRGPGRGMGRGFGPGGGDPNDTRPRYFISVNHTVQLSSLIRLAEGEAALDPLAGEALGGEPLARHSAQLEGGLFWKGLGLRTTGRYTGPARLAGGDLPGAEDLRFGALATLDLRLFADIGTITKAEDGWRKGLRVALVADNVFDAQRRVTDESGAVPDAYAPDRLDPVGRYLGIDIRKAF